MKLANSCLLLISLIVYTAQAAPAVPEKKFSVSIYKNPNYVPNARNQVQKNNQGYSNSTNTQTNGTVLLEDFQNSIYQGIVYVGTPPKPFLVQFDTGSSDFWIGSSLCSTCSTNTYNPFESSTFVPDGNPWGITYGDHTNSSGILVHDTAEIGGITISNLSIYAATLAPNVFMDPKTTGLLGLAFDSLATNPGIKTPFQEMVDRNLISSPVFGVYLGNETSGSGGEIVFGGYDSSHIGGDLVTVPVNNASGLWEIESTRIGVAKTTFVNEAVSLIIDTGTASMLFPKKVALEIAKHYKATEVVAGTFNITCNTNEIDPLEFDIAGNTFTISSESLIAQKLDDGCVAGFSYGEDPNQFLFGDVFIKNFYMIFNIEVPQIQMATVK